MRKPQSNVFFKIFFPVTAVICVMVVIITLLFSTVFEKNGIEAVTDEYLKTLHMIRNLYTEIHFAVIPAALNVFGDSRVREFLFAEEFQYDIVLAGLKEIDKTIILNNYIHSIYLYNQDAGFLSTSKGYRSTLNSSDKSLLALLQGPLFKQSAIIPRRVLFEGDKSPENVFSFINGGFDSASGMVKYAFVFNLSESKIRKMLVSDYPENEAEFYIVDSNGVFFSHPNPELFNTSCEENEVIRQVLQKNAASGGQFFSDAQNRRWLATWSDQTELGWRFLYLTPEKKLFAEVTELRNQLFVISVAVLIFSLFLLIFMTYRIESAVEFEKQLAGYIQGFSEFGEKGFGGKKFYSGLLRFDVLDSNGFCGGKTEKNALQPRRHGYVTAELNSRRKKTRCIYLGDTIYFTLSEKPSSWFYDDFFKLRQKSVSEFNSEVTAVYSACACSFDEIPAVYELLKSELQQTYMVSQGLSRKIICSPTTGFVSDKKLADEFDFSRLEQALKTKNAAKIRIEIEDLRNYLFDKKDYFLFRTSVVQTGLIAARIFEKSLDPFLSGGMDGWRNALFQCEQISGFISLLEHFADSVENSRNLPAGANENKITRHVKNFVTDNIQNKNLNSAQIADSLGLSLNYVRELFKRTEKISINDYISLYRLELAKQYLAGTDKTIYEICDIVGFSNYPYFCTYFKKIDGVSPSEFRLNMRILK